MKDALTRGGRRVAAEDAHRSREYLCTSCGMRVYLVATGGTQLPHFRHVPNEAARNCPHYVLGNAAGSSPRNTSAVEDVVSEPGLGIELLSDGGWSLFVRVPEIPHSEMSGVTLPALASARVRVRAGGNEVGRMSALDIRPGVGIGRAFVPPATSVYQLTPEGTWPFSIVLQRWRGFARGLDRRGSIFRLRRGEWLRIREGSTVEWGEQLVLVAETAAPRPPRCAERTLCEVTYAGTVWTARQITLPRTEETGVRDWFARLRIDVADRAWFVYLSTVPAEFDEAGVPAYLVGEAIVCSLSAPFNETTFAYLRRDDEQLAVPVTADSTSRCFVKCSATAVGRYSVSVGDALAAKQVFTVRSPPAVEELRAAIDAAPRLVVKCGDLIVRGWGETAHLASAADSTSLEVTTTHGDLSAAVSIGWSDGRHEHHALDESLSEVTQRLRRAVAEKAVWVRIDAGALGSVLVTVDVAKSVVLPSEQRASRLAGYISNRLALGRRVADPAWVRSSKVLGARVASLAAFQDPVARNLLLATEKGQR